MAGLIEFFLLVVFGFFSSPDYSVFELEEINARVTANQSGREYEEALVSVFSHETTLKKECNISTLDERTVFILIDQQGSVQQVYVEPSDEVADCISQSIKQVDLPQPSTDFVAKIEF